MRGRGISTPMRLQVPLERYAQPSPCAGTATNFNWEGALAHAASVALTTGVSWRMPNVKELKSLVENACYDMAINQTAFPATPSYAWSGSPLAVDPGGAWSVSFNYGNGYWYSKYEGVPVRLVRGQ